MNHFNVVKFQPGDRVKILDSQFFLISLLLSCHLAHSLYLISRKMLQQQFRVTDKFFNMSSSFRENSETFRSARTLCKLWSEDNMAELADRLQVRHAHLAVHHVAVQLPDVEPLPPLHPQPPTDACCCPSHCRLTHQQGPK